MLVDMWQISSINRKSNLKWKITVKKMKIVVCFTFNLHFMSVVLCEKGIKKTLYASLFCFCMSLNYNYHYSKKFQRLIKFASN